MSLETISSDEQKYEQQDIEITEAVQLWHDKFVTAEELIADAICRVYRPKTTGTLEEAMVDVTGSLDVYIRCHDKGLLSDEMYNAVLVAVQESEQLA